MSVSVAEFYHGKTVLLTGATGYLAKIILEKLLRSTSCKKIFLLMRAKKDVSVQQRLQTEILESALFEPLFDRRRDLLSKINSILVPIAGDLSLPNLGISEADRQSICAETEVIINSAANTSTFTRLKEILNQNYSGTVRLVELANKCPKLIIFSHVSTAYVGTNMPPGRLVREKINDDYSKLDWEEQIKLIKSLPDDECNRREKELLNGYLWPYLYVKNLCERYLERYARHHRVVINRPAAVCHCAREPLVGWTETVSAPGMFCFPAYMGMLRTYYLPKGIKDIVPADICSNAIIATTAYGSSKPKGFFQIYHNNSTGQNPF